MIKQEYDSLKLLEKDLTRNKILYIKYLFYSSYGKKIIFKNNLGLMKETFNFNKIFTKTLENDVFEDKKFNPILQKKTIFLLLQFYEICHE